MADPIPPADTGDLGAAAKRIPPAGWAAIIGIGVLAGLYLRHRAATNTSTAATASTPPTDATGVGGTVFTPSQTGATQPVAIQGPPKATTNLDWLNQAETFLIAKGVDAGVASTALHGYLNGDQLDTAGSAAVKLALGEFGEPPEGIPPPHFTPPPPNTVPSSPPPARTPLPGWPGGPPFTAVVKAGDTWESFATFYRGNPDQWPDIARANGALGSAPLSAYFPGQSKSAATRQPTPGEKVTIPGARA